MVLNEFPKHSCLLKNQEAERLILVHEVHDICSYLFTLFHSQLHQMFLQAKGQQHLEQTIEQMIGLLEKSQTSISQLLNRIHPCVLNLGLDMALDSLSTEFTRATGIPVSLCMTLPESPLSNDIEVAIYRIVQEALTNIATHSHASQVALRITADNRQLFLTLTDNGVGFISEQKESNKYWGINGMRERAQLLNGSFYLHSEVGQGTTIRVVLPLDACGCVSE